MVPHLTHEAMKSARKEGGKGLSFFLSFYSISNYEFPKKKRREPFFPAASLIEEGKKKMNQRWQPGKCGHDKILD